MVAYTRLRLHGFKSFAEPVEVPLEPGLTGLVGPNGCGKSNLVEALRWAMGESSARRLRGGEMDDLIFAGTDALPSRNLAEVRISLDNKERVAPALFNDADTLEVSRRIRRGGGSSFRVNGREARAADVRLLFADLASGASSNALVPQGKVAALINAKPGDRRALLEEAAGIAGLYARRREAEQRLRAANANLERLEDTRQGLAQRKGQLERQARQALRFREARAALQQFGAQLALLNWMEAEAALQAAHTTQIARETAAGAAQRRLAECERELVAAEDGMEPLRLELNAARAVCTRLEQEQAVLTREGEQLAQQRATLEQRLTELKSDAGRETRLAEETRLSLQAVAREREQLAAEQTRLKALALTQAETLNTAEQALRAQQAELAEAKQALALAESQAEDAARRMATAEQDLTTAETRLAKLETQYAAQVRDRATPELAGLEAALAEAEARQAGARQARDAAEQEMEQEEAETAKRQAAAREAAQRLAALESEARGLGRLVESGEGAQGEGSRLLGKIEVEAGWEEALSAALGERLQARLEANGEQAYLTGGKRVPSFNWPEGIEPLGARVRGPEVLAAGLAALGWAETPEAAQAAQSQLAPGQAVTSRAGGLWCWDGYTVPPGAARAEGVWLKQKARLAELREEAEAQGETTHALSRAAEQGEARSLAAREARQLARQALSAAEEAVRRAQRDLQSARATEARETQAHEALTRDLGLARALVEEKQGQVEVLRGQALEGQSALASVREATPLAGLEAAEVAAGAALKDAREAREQSSRALVSCEAQLGALNSRNFDLEAQRTNALRQAEVMQTREAEGRAALEQLVERPVEIERGLGALVEQLEQAQAAAQAADEALASAQSTLAGVRERKRRAEQEAGQATEALIRAQSAQEQASASVLSLRATIQEQFGREPETLRDLAGLEPGTEPPERSDVTQKRERLQREIDAMGPVNLAAAKDLEAVEAELTALDAELADVGEAAAKLSTALNRLNRDGRKRLKETLEIVDQAFRELFVRLFGGGKAELRLVGEDPLEADLEVMAMPPGKKLAHLQLLSGGEQTLTAIALIFAAFKANPSPLCVLDEVDAPLDDANVLRLIELVRHLSEETGTRFLLVTHHGVSMAKVDRLFGVTMPEPGVSKVLSLQLEDALAYEAAS